MRIMVTGADGYIGKGVVSHLLDADTRSWPWVYVRVG